MAEELYFDDFEEGQSFQTGSHTVTRESATRFAQEYDPQYFHVDEEAARHGPFGRLVVSGWQTAAIAMRLKAETELSKIAGGMVGMGLESVTWPLPVYPGDTLRAVITVIGKRRSQSRPTHGIVKYRLEMFNQADEKVMEMVAAIWAPC